MFEFLLSTHNIGERNPLPSTNAGSVVACFTGAAGAYHFMSIDSVYNAKILDYAGNIERIGRLENPNGSAKAHSKLCGSTVIVDVDQQDGRVSDFAQDVKACALGQASAAILAKNVIGCTLDELQVARQQMLAMLKENGPPPTAKFEELKFLEPVRDYRARHASTMLAFDAVVSAMQQALDKQDEVA